MKNARIGDYLVDLGLLKPEQLEEVLRIQSEARENGQEKQFGDIVVEQGFMSEINFAKALAGKLHVPYVELSTFEFDPETVRKIPEHVARKYAVIAIQLQGKRLTVATDDPIDFEKLEDVKVLTGYDCNPVLATRSAIEKAIGKNYQMDTVSSVLDDVNALASSGNDEDDASAERVESAPIVRLATTIVENSYRADATDIHIEPFASYTRIRIRVNGDLIELMNVSSQVHSALVTRLKIVSGMNIAEKRVPQDGRFSQVVDGKTLDVRVSSLPMVHGEKIVIRILAGDNIALRKITELGMSDYNYEKFAAMIKCPNGVVLVTGPTGSGKTTTLYAALGEVAKPYVNVVTVEDPVEKRIDGINQCQINAKAGMTFAAALRSILRQDPDIVMIGEMRDSETAEIGIRAAITGHLVFSTLHTNDAASTITRLVDMGIPPYMVATSLIGVVAQRLVKVLCPKCRKPRYSDDEENKLMHIDESVAIFEAAGCPECNNTGYRGRTAIHEIIHCTPAMSALIADGGNVEAISNLAKEQGTKLLRDNVSEKVMAGETTIDELVRVTYSV